MKILGLDIKRVSEIQHAEPTRKKVSSGEIGESGTDSYVGYIDEEYNSKLAGTQGIETYDKMRKSDATVRAAVLATQLPIRRANWFVQPASEDDSDKQIADFVSRALFEWQTITWDDILRHALLSLVFGVMVFEKVFAVKNFEGKDYIVWKKLAPRMPKSIQAWQTADGSDGIKQTTRRGIIVSIPIEKLVIFVNEKEGDNWWGTSILRASYKHWYMKDVFYKIDSIGFERQGLGIPFVKLKEGMSQLDRNRAKELLKNIRAHHNQHIIEPPDMDVEFKDMKSSTTRDPSRSIAHHNREIVKAVLAQFLELGANEVGSRALSEDQSSMFLLALEAVANNIVDTFNTYAIPQLVDYNFNDVQAYPKLEYSGIAKTDIEKLSTAYQRLTQSGAIKAVEGDEQYFRELMGLPEREDDDDGNSKVKADKKEIDKDMGDLNLHHHRKKKERDPSVISSAIDRRLSRMSDRQRDDFLSKKIERLRKYSYLNDPFVSIVRKELSSKLDQVRWLTFKEENNFKSWRKLTFAEQKVSFETIQDKMDELEQVIIQKGGAVLNDARETFIDKLSRALKSEDKNAIKDLKFQLGARYKSVLKEVIKDAVDFGKSNAAREMKVNTPPLPKSVSANIDIVADTIAAKHIDELTNEAKLVLVNQLNKGENSVQVIAKVDEALAGAIVKKTKDTAAISVAGNINLGRQVTFEKNSSKIYALQRSEILDLKTCNFCLSVDGRIVDKTDSLARVGTFHSYCRGIWVEILQEEEEKPKISGVPQSIRDRVGDATNELIQPKKPIVKKDSLAKKQIDKGKAGRK